MASSSQAARALAGVGGLIASAALLLQFVLLAQVQGQTGRGIGYAALLYFGFFTILTNALCALVLAAALVRPARSAALHVLQSAWLATSAAAAITIVGAVYVLVLRRLWHPTGLQFWADAALHYATPLLFLAFWVAAVPARSVRWADLPRILLYPLLYLVYVFVRGAVTGLYPYFFIEVPAIGLAATVRNTAVVLAAFLAAAAVLILINRRGAAPSAPPR